jgi:putative SOS response-associated peptidase YedK
MCGRFTLRTPASAVAEQFGLAEILPLEPRFNIAPTQTVAVVRQSRESRGARELVWMRWGLIPGWADDPAIGNRMINARAETAAQKPAFRQAFRRRRCLLVADGFYEWQRVGKRKQPYYLRMRDERPFGMAGLWETWRSPEDETIRSCTILTTEANSLVVAVHDRMPVIIDAADYDRWLDPAIEDPDELTPLLYPYSSNAMVAYPVGDRVNKPGNDGPGCVEGKE